MSGLSRKPGIIGAVTYVREVPLADMRHPDGQNYVPAKAVGLFLFLYLCPR